MKRKIKGLLGELNAEIWFVKNEYEVYKPTNDNATYDMLVVKDGFVSKVSVKSTSVKTASNKWSVELRNISRRNNSNINISYFDNTYLDFLAVYIIPENRIVVIDAKTITSKNVIVID